jgi:phage-related tail fiber protein
MAVRKPLVLVAGAVSELPTGDTATGGGSATVPQDFKDSVDVATTGNVTLSGEQTIDGVTTAASRVLVWQNTTGSQNGLYLTAAGAWSRTTDADASAEVTSGLQVYVEGGTVNGGQTFVLITPDTITLGTTALTFTAAPIAPATFVGKTVTGTTYTHIVSDSGKRLNLTNAAAKTVTVAPNSSVASPVNTEIDVFNVGAGTATIAPGAGVVINAAGGVLTLQQFQGGKLKKRANANTWDFTPYNYPASSGLTFGAALDIFNLPTFL